jgi:hypothetical protein
MFFFPLRLEGKWSILDLHAETVSVENIYSYETPSHFFFRLIRLRQLLPLINLVM